MQPLAVDQEQHELPPVCETRAALCERLVSHLPAPQPGDDKGIIWQGRCICGFHLI